MLESMGGEDAIKSVLLRVLEEQQATLTRGMYVREWPEDEKKLFREANNWKGSEKRQQTLEAHRRDKLATALTEALKGVEAPAEVWHEEWPAGMAVDIEES